MVPDVAAAGAEYGLLLGQAARTQAIHDMRLDCENIGLVLQPLGAERAADSGLPLSLMFGSVDLAAAAHRLARRGLPGEMRAGVLHLDPDVTHGVGIGVVAAELKAPVQASEIVGLDHVVIRTPDAERAVALYGGRLGLDLRLDRVQREIGVRQMFFVLGGLVVEIVQSSRTIARQARTACGASRGGRAISRPRRARLAGSGIAVSEMRDGRKRVRRSPPSRATRVACRRC